LAGGAGRASIGGFKVIRDVLEGECDALYERLDRQES